MNMIARIVFLTGLMGLILITACSKSSTPPKEFLSSKFRVAGQYGVPDPTNWESLAQTFPSVKTCTVEKLYGAITGDKSWEKSEKGWILRTVITDEVTKKKGNGAFVFENTSDGIVITRAVFDNQDYPQSELISYVLGIMEHTTQDTSMNDTQNLDNESQSSQDSMVSQLVIPAETRPLSEEDTTLEKDIIRREKVEVSGVIEFGHDEAGGYYMIDCGDQKQYTLLYGFDNRLNEDSTSIIESLIEKKSSVRVVGTLKFWSDGSVSFDERAPIEFYI